MSKTLAILATNTALTGTTEETVMQSNPFPANILVDDEIPVVLTVTRNGSIVQYAHCTTGAYEVEVPYPVADSGRHFSTIRNTRDWDYAMRSLALNGLLEAGDVIEVKQANAWSAVARLEVVGCSLAPKWSEYGIRQPIEHVLVELTVNSRRYHGDNGGWCSRITGWTHPVTGLVEANLSRW